MKTTITIRIKHDIAFNELSLAEKLRKRTLKLMLASGNQQPTVSVQITVPKIQK